MRRYAYYRLCRAQSAEWLMLCLTFPSAYMCRRHLALIRLAIRGETRVKQGGG